MPLSWDNVLRKRCAHGLACRTRSTYRRRTSAGPRCRGEGLIRPRSGASRAGRAWPPGRRFLSRRSTATVRGPGYQQRIYQGRVDFASIRGNDLDHGAAFGVTVDGLSLA